MNRLRHRHDDAGFSLTELLAYIVVLAIVLGMGAAIFIRIIQGQTEIRTMAEANNEAQVVFKEIEDDLRNAAWATVGHGGDLMVVQKRSATPGAHDTVVCVGYYLDTTTDTLYRSSSTSNTDTHAALAAGSDATLRALAAAWPTSRADMGTVGSAVAFGPLDGTYTSPELVEVSLRANLSDTKKPIDFTKSVSLRKQSGFGSGCG